MGDEIDVEVTATTDADDETSTQGDDTTTVVIVEGDESESAPQEMDRALDVESRLTALEISSAATGEVLESLTQRVASLEATESVLAEAVEDIADNQADMAEVVTETAADTVDEAPDRDGDGKPDEVPDTARTHWLTRPWSEWRGSR